MPHREHAQTICECATRHGSWMLLFQFKFANVTGDVCNSSDCHSVRLNSWAAFRFSDSDLHQMRHDRSTRRPLHIGCPAIAYDFDACTLHQWSWWPSYTTTESSLSIQSSNTASIHQSTVKRVFREDLPLWKVDFKWIGHLLDDDQKLERIRLSTKLLEFLKSKLESPPANVYTGDEM
jgi:hypothetical protein